MPHPVALALYRSVLEIARTATKGVPNLVVTENGSPAHRELLIQVGADQVLVEPCAPELLAAEAKRLARLFCASSIRAAAPQMRSSFRRERALQPGARHPATPWIEIGRSLPIS